MSTILKPKSMSVSDDGGVLAVGIESSAPMTIASSTLSKRTATTAAKRCVKSVVVKDGVVDCCRVCGLTFEDMPDKSKLYCCIKYCSKFVQGCAGCFEFDIMCWLQP